MRDSLSGPALPPRATVKAAADPATTSTAAATATAATTAAAPAAATTADAPGPEAAALGWLASAASYLSSFSAAPASAAPASAAPAAASEGAQGPGGAEAAEGAAPSTPPRRASSRLPPIAGTPPSLPASPRTVNI